MARPGSKQVREALAKHAEPSRAKGMQAYLKSEMPCLGVKVPVARQVAKTLFSAPAFESEKALETTVWTLWDSAEFREERFVALNVLRLRPHREWVTAKVAPLLKRLILSGAWWDLVDELSSHVVRQALENDAKMEQVVKRWARSDELWLKRAALVCQVVRGDETNVELLGYAIEHAVDGKDFFLRKGIGWAMRSAAKHHGAAVRGWLKQWEGRLSPLSVREAMKGLS